MFEDIFKNKKLDTARLPDIGLEGGGDICLCRRDIMNGTFTLYVYLGENELPYTKLIEKDTDEEYFLYKTDAQGTFVGDVRSEIERVLAELSDMYYVPAVFKSRQMQALIEFVRSTYGGELEFLWEKFPDNAVWRRKDNKKWYAAVLTVSKSKLGFDSDERAEIIDLRADPEHIGDILSLKNYYPGWHMNKKSWYTIILDGSVDDDELMHRVRDSYALAGVQ